MNYKSGDIIMWLDRNFKAIAIDYVLNFNINNNGLLYIIELTNLNLNTSDHDTITQIIDTNGNDGDLAHNFKIFHWED